MKKSFLNNIGFTITELILVTSILGIVPATVYVEAAKHAKAISCLSNLRNIYFGLQMYEMDHGRLPNAKFYPESPNDPKSIANILRNYVDDRKAFVCPAMPAKLAKRGLTYIWNDSYNNMFTDRILNRSSEWALTDMSAADPKIPPPHHGSYNVIFFDGHSKTVKTVTLTPK